MKNNCLICRRISQITKNENPNFITELKTGYVVLADYQLFKGYVIFLCKLHKKELFELEEEFRNEFLMEMAWVAEALDDAFKPKKTNCELLGNKEPHLHWHIIPRRKTDLEPSMPIWALNESIRNSEKYKIQDNELKKLKNKILKSLSKVPKIRIINSFDK